MTSPTGTMRPWTAVLSASAAVAAVIGLAAAVALMDDTDQVSPDSTQPSTVGTSELVPATDASLVAVALQHVDVDEPRFDLLYRDDGRYTDGTLGGDIRFDYDGESDGDLLRVLASPGEPELDPCELGADCATQETDAGVVTIAWEEEVPEEDPGFVAVSLQRGSEYLRVLLAGPAITGDPTDLDLAVSVDDLVAIVTDPRFGLRTTQEMVEAGEALDFP